MLGAVTLAALALAVIMSCTMRLNVGLLAIALAWFIGVYIGDYSVREITDGFPTSLFLTLAGVTLLFSQAHVNGTLEKVAHGAARFCKGRVGLIPVMYFLLAAGLASAGPGNIATAGLLAPIAMATALRFNISPFLMAIMVGNGCGAGSLSPIAPTGIIVTGLMERVGLDGFEIHTWAYNLTAHAIVAFGGYLIFGGWKLLASSARFETTEDERTPLDKHQRLTLAAIAALIAGVMTIGVDVGMAAFTVAVFLQLMNAADDNKAIKNMPWSTILMVCGVTVLISLLEETGGMDLLTGMLSSVSTQSTIIPFLAATVGLISAYSSTSGVVLPVFIPTVPGLIEGLGAGSPLALASTMNVASHLVDVSPLSTIGALCIASLPAGDMSRRLFNQLLAWGFSMVVVGAVICMVLFGWGISG